MRPFRIDEICWCWHPLPVKRSTLFLAKIAALFAAPALAIVALNIFSGVIWPLHLQVPQRRIRWRAASHGLPIGSPSLRRAPSLCSPFSRYRAWRPICCRDSSSFVCPRSCKRAVMCLLLSVYFLEPSLESPAALASPQNQRLLEWLPSYWFLALFNQLNGSMHPALVPLARRAWIGLGCVCARSLRGIAFVLLPYDAKDGRATRHPARHSIAFVATTLRQLAHGTHSPSSAFEPCCEVDSIA